MLPKDTILELQVRPYSHLFNGQSKCSNQGPVLISRVQPFGQQGLQWLCLDKGQLILKASFKVEKNQQKYFGISALASKSP